MGLFAFNLARQRRAQAAQQQPADAGQNPKPQPEAPQQPAKVAKPKE